MRDREGGSRGPRYRVGPWGPEHRRRTARGRTESRTGSGTQVGDRRVPGQGPHHRRVPRQRSTSSSPPSATSATSRRARPTRRPRSRTSRGAGSASTSSTTSSRYYVVPRDKKSHITKLKSLLKDADELYLATDEDREGEAIAWHLLDELKPKVPVHRMVFHEITKAGDPGRGRQPPRARHGPGRGAGGPPDPRPALRLRGLPGAVAQGHVGTLGRPGAVGGDPAGGRPGARADRVPRRVLLGPRGHLRRRVRPRRSGCSRPGCTPSTAPGWRGDRTSARTASCPSGGSSTSTARPPRPWSRRWRTRRSTCGRSSPSPTAARPTPPFRTTTLQQEASRKLGMTASGTMSVAQRLYENGFITYMRTDSTTLSGSAVNGSPDAGPRAVRRRVPPRQPRTYASQGEERAGGARGDPPGRRVVPHPGPDRADRRRSSGSTS